jgi:uncharacterized protein (DUF58 family)
MILPTRRALVLFAGLAPVALLGFAHSLGLDLLIALDIGLLAAVVVDARLSVDPKRIEIDRRAPEGFSVGRQAEISYLWRNPTRHRARLSVREIRPDLLGGVQEARSLDVPAQGVRKESLTAWPRERGRERAGWFALRSQGPLGLGMRQVRVSLPWSVLVYPSLPASRLKAAIAAAVRRRDPGLKNIRRLGVGRQFESLREWVPGDDTRLIDWKATSRHRKLIAREFEEERRQQVLLVLDAGRLLTAEVAGVSRMEYVVRAAMWLAFAAHHHDDDVGAMVFADEVMHYVAPERGRRGLSQILDVLAVTQPRLVEPDYPAAFRYLAIRNRKRALTILFTDVIDRLASQALVANVGSLRPRHLPLVVTLRDPEIDRLAEAVPEEVDEAYRKAAAEDLLAARGTALSEMRRTGAVVLDVEPDTLSTAVVEKYLELKRHGRL